MMSIDTHVVRKYRIMSMCFCSVCFDLALNTLVVVQYCFISAVLSVWFLHIILSKYMCMYM